MFSRPTTKFEQFLLFILVSIVIPFEIQLSISKTIGIAWVYFGVLAAYVFCFRLPLLLKTLGHPLIILLGFFIAFIFFLEAIRPFSDYDDHKQLLQVLVSGTFIACIARDERATAALMWGSILGGVILAILFLGSSYATLTAFSDANPQLASEARKYAFSKLGIKGNTNFLALYIGQGFVSSLLFLLWKRHTFKQKMILLLAAALTGFGVAISMSRGAVLCTILATFTVLVLLKKINPRTAVYALCIGLVAFPLLPKVVFERYSNVDTNVGAMRADDARTLLYRAATRSFPDYVWFGVGAGNFWNQWGFENGFSLLQHEGKGVIGSHNSFLQSLINWGIFSVCILAIAVLMMLIMSIQLPLTMTSVFIKAYGITVFTTLLTTTALHMKIVSVFIGLLLTAYLILDSQKAGLNRLSQASKDETLNNNA